MPAPGVFRIVEKQEFSSGFGWPLALRGGQFRCRVASFLSARLHAVALARAGCVVAAPTQNAAGPFCTQILGDRGAGAVRGRRRAGGRRPRSGAPPYWGEESATFMAMNRNKKSLALDLKADGGLEVLRRLIARADVFVQSLRAGALGELGLDFAGAARINPRLVYCSITAFGARGPLADLPGYDPLMQAYGGLMSVNGHSGQEPARVGTSIVDMGTGMWAALGIVAALRQRDTTGHAVEVTTALFETALMWVSYHAMGYLGSGEVPQPQGSGTAMIAPYQAFPTADGYAMVAAGSDALFHRLPPAPPPPPPPRPRRPPPATPPTPAGRVARAEAPRDGAGGPEPGRLLLRPPPEFSGRAGPAPVTALADRSQAAPCSGHPRSFPASRTPLQ